jgi:UDP-N-acetylmuramoyl-L-alanyl-D-glutamate--2,6-diaminopimelate ligase
MKGLNELFKNIEVIDQINGDIDEVEGIAYHSKKVDKNNLFVCIKGYKTDGHKYLAQAVNQGAIAAIVESFVEEVNIPQYKVRDSRLALAAVASEFYEHPSKDLKVTGITATNGKTTTAYMLNSILEEEAKTGVIGTVGVKIGDDITLAILTTPQSLDLQKDLYDMKKADCEYVSMEVSSSAQELKRAEFVDYDVVTLNNISREHIDNHGSFENYFFHKSKLIREAKEDIYAVLNLDDSYSKSLINKTKANVITYGIEDKSGHLTIGDIDMSTGFPQFEVEILKDIEGYQQVIKPQKFMVNLNVSGYHSIYNSIVAISVALIYGISIEQIQKGLAAFTGIERRFEMIYNEDFMVIDDHFANPGNIDVTLKTLNFMTYNKLHMVYALRGSRGVTTTEENANMMVKWIKKLNIDKIYVSLSVNHVSDKDKVTEDELEIFTKIMNENNIKIELYDDLDESIDKVLDDIQKSDLLLLAGCQGMDYGCNILLNKLAERKPELDQKKLFKPLETRVAGLLKNLNI